MISRQAWEACFGAIYIDPFLWLISGQANFDTIYANPAPVAHLRTSLEAHVDVILVIPHLWLISGQASEAHFRAPPVWLISGQAWEAHFDTIYGNLSPVVHLRTSLGGTFRRYLR